MNFDIEQKARKGPRDQFLIKLPILPATIDCGILTLVPSKNPIELCGKLKLLL